MSDDDIEELIGKFRSTVPKVFQFLEVDYNYDLGQIELEDVEYRKDTHISARYLSGLIGVEVVWGIGQSSLSVPMYELVDGKVPEKLSFYGHAGFSRGIQLHTLVEFITNGKVEPPLPRITSDLSFAEMGRRADRCTELIRTELVDLIQIQAERLRTYSHDVLLGDTSLFPTIQEYHRKIWHVDI